MKNTIKQPYYENNTGLQRSCDYNIVQQFLGLVWDLLCFIQSFSSIMSLPCSDSLDASEDWSSSHPTRDMMPLKWGGQCTLESCSASLGAEV